jgi:hypothetical protein
MFSVSETPTSFVLDVFCVCVSPYRTVWIFIVSLWLFSVLLHFIKMDTYHAAFWSDLSYSSSDEEDRYRTTHQKRTKQRGNKEQRVLESWTWEEILDGKGPWAQAGEYRRPKEELEAVKAELSQLPVLTGRR